MGKTDEISKEQKGEFEKQQLFISDYNQLCEKWGFRFRARIGLKQQMDGTFTLSSDMILEQFRPSE